MLKIPNLLAFGKHCHNCGKWMQRRALRKDENETNSEHMESGTSSGNKMNVKTSILINSGTETNHSKCKEYTKGEFYYSPLSSAERSKPMRLPIYEDINCVSSYCWQSKLYN
ncbi:hypothetical protein WA026_002870 [Henosepilachna vigintioctopunctata]|uniref:Uncharacterized protein n=1 Tax=Henosepilachna vigintioctopunctata TaxID=420089 RepID=A0AAW1TGV0_9CUCU